MAFIDLPQPLVGEISLIGTGGGYGESCVIHLGENNWIVIDSCVDPNSKVCLPLQYLKEIGVNIAVDVKLVLCTHWHDDHIRGISQLFAEAKAAALGLAGATDMTKFLKMVALDYEKLSYEVSNVSTKEFNTCFDITHTENRRRITAVQDKLIFVNRMSNSEASVIALSPSQLTMERYHDEISTLITEYGANRRIPLTSPNARSVVTFLKLGGHRAILGADLECSKDESEGWLEIINTSTAIDKKSSYFKIPHHGSETGYHSRIWLELLSSEPHATLTPWNKKEKLPTMEMLQAMRDHSRNIYMTSPIANTKAKSRSKSLEKLIKQFNSSLSEIKFVKGIVRARIDLLDENSTWRVDLFDSAFQVK